MNTLTAVEAPLTPLRPEREARNGMRVGVIRTLTTDDPALLNTHGRALEAAYGYRTTSKCIPGHPFGVFDAESHVSAVPSVVALVEEFADSVDAIIISGATDPGLAEARLVAKVPVIGAGSAAAAVALAFGGTVGVLGLASTAPSPISELLHGRLATVQAPFGVSQSMELLTLTGVFETVDAAERLVAAGAEVIVEACAGLTSIGIAPELRRRLGVPVIDAVLAAGAVLSSGADTRQLATL